MGPDCQRGSDGVCLLQIHNMTLIVNQLETFDKKNLELIRLEFLKLQRKLEECQEEQEYFKPDIGPLSAFSSQVNTSTIVTLLFFSPQATATTLEL